MMPNNILETSSFERYSSNIFSNIVTYGTVKGKCIPQLTLYFSELIMITTFLIPRVWDNSIEESEAQPWEIGAMGIICYLNKEFFFLKECAYWKKWVWEGGMFFTPVFLTSEVISPALTK